MLNNTDNNYEEKFFKYGKILFNQIIPKFQNLFNDENIRIKWEAHFNYLYPQTSLGYTSEEDFLDDNYLTKHDIIKNSILHVFPYIEDGVINDLYEHFLPLLDSYKIWVLVDCNKAVYIEIIKVLEYIKKIQKIIDRYNTPDSDHKGTAHRSSSLADIVQTQINLLENRLIGAYFKIQNEDEIEQTELILKLLKKSQEDQYKNIMEFLHYAKLLYGLDMKLLEATQNEIIAIEQVLNFYNGIKSTPTELVKSVMIFINNVFIKSKIFPKEKADHILFIANYFFPNEFKAANVGKRNNLIFTKEHLNKFWRIKTILHHLPIFAFSSQASNNFLLELYKVGINDLMGLQNLFEPDQPTINNVSELYLIRNLVKTRKLFNFTKEELKVLLFFAQQIQFTDEEKIPFINTINL